ncbi:MAG TPA: wax ester/triacylglycerol synthase domain-containing protein [Acidimicrobiales bacterium]|nr:wax ester/triacylglycerol synthase domain-containing protein [Acidimicrobiales bacterium]
MADAAAPKGSLERQREHGFARRMSDQEALMWNIEKDPWLNPNGAALTILDRPIDVERMRARVRYGLSRLPRLRERVVPGLGRLSPPVWATDREFDLDYHVRHVALPAPGSMRQLLDLVTRLYEEPYDRTRPLWLFYAIEGLEGGRGALLSKQHHAVADGIGALRMAEVYTDVERDVPPPPEVDLERILAEAVEAERDELLEAGADMSSSIVDTATRTFTYNLRRQGGIAVRAATSVGGAALDPVRTVGGLVGSVRSTLDTVGGGRTVDATAPLWQARSRRRHLEVLSLPLDAVRMAAKALGGSVNDLYVTGAAMATIAYHEQRAAPIEAFTLSFVVSTRTDKAVGGNSFTPVPVQVLVGGPSGPAERFRQVRDLMAERRERVGGGRGALAAISGLANLLPTSVTTRVARQQAGRIDLATSNLRGAPFPTYIAGGEVLHGYPLGPVSGTAGNITTISQNGKLDIGLLVDPAAIGDPAGFAADLGHAYDQLLEAGGRFPLTRRPPGPRE